MQKEKQQTLEDISGLALSLGMCKSIFQGNNLIISHMPLSLYPYIIKASVYDELKHLHLIWQKLFIKIANDKNFVINLAQVFCKNDPYMSRILQIYKNQINKDDKNLSKVACTRVDYMGDDYPLLVQYNLMSVGLNGMSDRVQTLHKILNLYKYPLGKYTYPNNNNQETICQALLKALQQSQLLKGIIVMVVHEKQFNYGDHFAFKMQMIKRGRRVQPITMINLIQKMKLDEKTQIASIQGRDIDAFYFRTGYSFDHFSTEKHWQIRQKIQRSRSIKLPSIDMIIINSKRFQSELSKRNVISKFLSEQQTQLLIKVSGQIYDFDNKTDLQVLQLIQKTRKSDYVLKPNRQGGGNNFFGQKAHEKLIQLYKEKIFLQNFILMKKINAQTHQNYFVFEHKPFFVPKATAQFSTLGCFIYKQGKIIMNEFGGTLVRLKKQEVNEGGIAINQGVLSGVCIQNFDDN